MILVASGTLLLIRIVIVTQNHSLASIDPRKATKNHLLSSEDIARLRFSALPISRQELISAMHHSEVHHHFTLELLHALLEVLVLHNELVVLLIRCLDFRL